MLGLRHAATTVDDELLDGAAQDERLDRDGLLLADAAGAADGLGLNLRVEHGAEEVDAGGAAHVEPECGLADVHQQDPELGVLRERCDVLRPPLGAEARPRVDEVFDLELWGC